MDVREVWAWPVGLLDEWIAYYSWRAKERAAAEKRAARKR